MTIVILQMRKLGRDEATQVGMDRAGKAVVERQG